MRTRGRHLEFWYAWRYAMALCDGAPLTCSSWLTVLLDDTLVTHCYSVNNRLSDINWHRAGVIIMLINLHSPTITTQICQLLPLSPAHSFHAISKYRICPMKPVFWQIQWLLLRTSQSINYFPNLKCVIFEGIITHVKCTCRSTYANKFGLMSLD